MSARSKPDVPTYELTESAERDYRRLNHDERSAFKAALKDFISDLTSIEAGEFSDFRRGLRVKPMRNADGIWEMTWEIADGRATFAYGPERRSGMRHVIWRRIGGHSVFDKP